MTAKGEVEVAVTFATPQVEAMRRICISYSFSPSQAYRQGHNTFDKRDILTGHSNIDLDTVKRFFFFFCVR